MVQKIQAVFNGNLKWIIGIVIVPGALVFSGWVGYATVNNSEKISTIAEKSANNEKSIECITATLDELKRIGYKNQALIEKLSD